jgi:K+-sensing histidine kinase KdpD
MDAVLVEQLLINLLEKRASDMPPQKSRIEISARSLFTESLLQEEMRTRTGGPLGNEPRYGCR